MYSTKNNGFQFLDFIRMTEERMPGLLQPVAGSFAVINCDGNYLLCYNTLRKQWELPAGRREKGETSKECAIRELYEETGQVVLDMTFQGLLQVKNSRNGQVKYNPVYMTNVDKLQPFVENEETSKIKLWNFNKQIGLIDQVDIKILNFV
ncbi:NUDIX domain-containing protein [Virgibacillus sp. DJP39]|uniref:NUDIX domain-containing protein n=1 Tax=Virgibacillus sp. DJP39 TaxID=3409790 RepID=UPI003BB4BD73